MPDEYDQSVQSQQFEKVESHRKAEDSQMDALVHVFRDQLVACLEECAAGRLGLFSDREPLSDGVTHHRPWPEAAQLRELAFALQAALAQDESHDELCDQFLDLCSIHGESDPGEPKLARAFLMAIAGKGR